MSDVVIKAERVSKKFCKSIKHVMLYGAKDIAKNTIGLSSNSESLREGEFWAVDDVSFELKRGETLGIIGQNGSGKSTILKMLNGIYMPDKGRIEIKGSVGALIEVGAGFHPMLTGRENIYVNGSILGISKKEIDKIFDEIIDFADIGDFIDSPVKHYSSGMYVRLGFAIAVHSEPDILLVDEILAVGDLNFQKKCFKKINDIKERGVAIILVSHNMGNIHTMCEMVLLLKNGKLISSGDVNNVINDYIYEDSKETLGKTATTNKATIPSTYGGNIAGTGDVILRNLYCYQKGKDKNVSEIDYEENILIEFEYEAFKKIDKPIFRINFGTQGYRVFANIDSDKNGLPLDHIEGKDKVYVELKKPNLYPGVYEIHLAVVTEDINAHYFMWNSAKMFIVKPKKDKLLCYPSALLVFDSEVTIGSIK